MRVTDRDTGKEFFLDSTPELKADLAPIYEACTHPHLELRQRRNRGGAIQYSNQCLQCGRSVGAFLKHSPKLANVSVWDEKLDESFHKTRESQRAAVYQKHVRIQRGREVGFWKTYNEYLKSDEWLKKRTRVLERANNQCEGCRNRRATQVHHLNYKHVFNEFLFELVALCDECHRRLHDDRVGATLENKNSILDDEGWEPPCCDCRWQTEHNDQYWCGILDVSITEALSENGDCGPKRQMLDPLR